MFLQYINWFKKPLLKLFLVGSLAIASQSAFAVVLESVQDDGIDDSVDNCPLHYNPEQTDTDLSYWGRIAIVEMDPGAYPGDPTSSKGDACDDDDDGDGVDDVDDAFPRDPHHWAVGSTTDVDNDGIGDALDNDDDNDGIDDVYDNCRLLYNPSQTDTDQDGVGDELRDPNNASTILEEGCDFNGTDSSLHTDTDKDGIENSFDIDDDGDDIADVIDNCPLHNDPDQTDADGDGFGVPCDVDDSDNLNHSDADGDGVGDRKDNCPLIPNPSRANFNTTRAGDACDIEDDRDGIFDLDDRFPYDTNEWADSDNDGVGDNSDAFPKDASEQLDLDDDGFGDNLSDAFPGDPLQWIDSDGDGLGDNYWEEIVNGEVVAHGDPNIDGDNNNASEEVDAFPYDPLNQTDRDNDGYGDQGGPNLDAFPDDPFEWSDRDGDGVGDNSDPFPDDPSIKSDLDGDGIDDLVDDDIDGDGHKNINDDFPYDRTETRDTDGDGVGDESDLYKDDPTRAYDTDGDGTSNNLDNDDDNDGIPDSQDNCPLIVNTDQTNTDKTYANGDDLGDACDPDDDNDGYDDTRDQFPLDKDEVLDFDGDGIGNNSDDDIDGDSVLNKDDRFPWDPNEYVDTDGDGVGDNTDRFPFNGTEQYDLDNDNQGDYADIDDDGDGINEQFRPDGVTLNPGLIDGEQLDNCPYVYNPGQTNTDKEINNNPDELGDLCDDDDDEDGVLDTDDAFPLDASETTDTDGDGTGDNSDVYPEDPNEQFNSDGDHMGNNSDPDDDNDGIPDSLEVLLYKKYQTACKLAESFTAEERQNLKDTATAADAIATTKEEDANTAETAADTAEAEAVTADEIAAAAVLRADAVTARVEADTARAEADVAAAAYNEAINCISPLNEKDALYDLDNDGISNKAEYHNGTDIDDANDPPATGGLKHFKFVPDDGALQDSFGASIAQLGNIAVVGSPNAKVNGIQTGAVYLFTKAKNVVNEWEWSQTTKLNPTHSNPDQHFGASVAIGSNGEIIVGATGDDENGPNTGAIYIFTQNGGNWAQQKIVPFDGSTDFYFGSSLVTTNDAIYVGAPGYSETGKKDAGAVYILSKANNWQTQQRIFPSDHNANHLFGSSMDISADGTSLVIGASGAYNNGPNTGAVYIFQCDVNGCNPQEQALLTANDAIPSDQFGTDVSILGSRLLVGANGVNDQGTNSGAVYVFEKDIGGAWNQAAKFIAPDVANNDFFATKVILTNRGAEDQAFVSTQWADSGTLNNSGATYMFTLNGANWIYQGKFQGNDRQDNHHFGSSISLLASENILLNGAIGVADNATQAGAVYSFDLTQLTTDTDSDIIFDQFDNCPTDSNQNQADLDGDAIGDVCDTDQDGDGVADADEIGFERDPSETTDTDGDGIGDNADPDAENDGIPDRIEEALYFEYETLCLATETAPEDAIAADTAAGTAETEAGTAETEATAARALADLTGTEEDIAAAIVAEANAIEKRAIAVAKREEADKAAEFAATSSIETSCIYPLVHDSSNDFDGDGVSNLDEYLRGTDMTDGGEKPSSLQAAYYKLLAYDGAANDEFGSSVFINGDTAIVGAPGVTSDDNKLEAGAAYIFKRNTNTDAWEVYKVSGTAEKLHAGADAADHAHFGSSVVLYTATNGDEYAVIGAPGRSNKDADNADINAAGKVYVFKKLAAGTTWTLEATLSPGTVDTSTETEMPNENTQFGSSVSASENIIVVGAPGEDRNAYLPNTGRTYIYETTDNVWAKPNLNSTKIVSDDGKSGDAFGISVATSGGYILVGSTGADTPRGSGNGAAYLFQKDQNGDWQEMDKLYAHNGLNGDKFGRHVTLSYAGQLTYNEIKSTPSNEIGSHIISAPPTKVDGEIDQWDVLVSSSPWLLSDGSTVENLSGLKVDLDLLDDTSKYYSIVSNTDTSIRIQAATDEVIDADALVGKQLGDPLIDTLIQRTNTFGAALVSAPNNDSRGINSGTAYLFEIEDRLGQYPITNIERNALTAPDTWTITVSGNPWLVHGSTQVDTLFGLDVDLDTNNDLAGVYEIASNTDNTLTVITDDDLNGYVGNTLANANPLEWKQTQQLLPELQGHGDLFGNDIALNYSAELQDADYNVNDPDNIDTTQILNITATAIIGAPFADLADTNSGAIHVFSRVSNNEWVEQVRLASNDTKNHEHFGTAVSISSDDKILVGAPQVNDVNFSAGASYVISINTTDIDDDKIYDIFDNCVPPNPDFDPHSSSTSQEERDMYINPNQLNTDENFEEKSFGNKLYSGDALGNTCDDDDDADGVLDDYNGDGVINSHTIIDPDTLEETIVHDDLFPLNRNEQVDFDKDGRGDNSDPDDDGDGISDDYEIDNGMNPFDPSDALTDIDGDGLTALEEYQNGSNANARDSDGDGYSDDIEIYYGTSPKNKSIKPKAQINSSPDQPSVIPVAAFSSSEAITLDSIPFVGKVPNDYLTAAEWEINTGSDFKPENRIINRSLAGAKSANDELLIRELRLPAGTLPASRNPENPVVTYWVRTRHKGTSEFWSTWSNYTGIPFIDPAEENAEIPQPTAESSSNGLLLVTASADTDSDGVVDAYQSDQFIDADENGVISTQEALRIKTLHVAESGKLVGIEVDKGALTEISSQPYNSIPSDVRLSATMPYGLISFRVEELDVVAGAPASVTITFHLPESMAEEAIWVGYDTTARSFSNEGESANILERRVTLSIRDGGSNDLDGVHNGTILSVSGAFIGERPQGTAIGGSGPVSPVVICSLPVFWLLRRRRFFRPH